jgi:hypothetical protein
MNHARISLALMAAIAIGGTACRPAAAEGPHVKIQRSEQKGEWVALTISVASDEPAEVEFRPGEVWLELADGSKAEVWRWSTFFSEASANLKKGDRITQVGTDIGGEVLALSFLELQPGSEATIVVPLTPGASQEAKLFFQSPSRSEPKRLQFGVLGPAPMP